MTESDVSAERKGHLFQTHPWVLFRLDGACASSPDVQSRKRGTVSKCAQVYKVSNNAMMTIKQKGYTHPYIYGGLGKKVSLSR